MGLSSQLKQLVDKDGHGENEADIAESLDVVQERTNQLKAIFPDVFSDGKVNFERLKAALGDGMARTNECYELSWAGKGDARREVQKRTTATLRPDTANSVNWDATQNLYIEGENLEVLRILQKAYFGKVKMIYIDPPYNTGNDSFVYPDDYSETLKEYQARTGETDESGFLNKQNLWKKNSKESGQFHSAWLSMMYPRLFLARNLLREDGVIFISINDAELANLRLLCNEIFGEDNSLTENPTALVWQQSGTSNGHFASAHEYILAYARNKKSLPYFALADFGDDSLIEDRAVKKISAANPRSEIIFPAGIRYAGDTATFAGCIGGTEQQFIDGSLEFVDGKLFREVKISAGWAMRDQILSWLDGEETFDTKGQKVKEFYFNKEGILWYVKERGTIHPKTILDKNVGSTKTGTKELSGLLNGNFFDYPKPSSLIKWLISFVCARDSTDVVLDFFSGSATTAQAVLELNEEDGGNRQFICAQMPELLEDNSEAYRAGFRTIADIGRTRIKKVIERIEGKRLANSRQTSIPGAEDRPKQALGFNALKLTPSNFKEWRTDINSEEDLLAQLEYHVDSTKPDSEAKCMVYELLLKMALPITTPVKCNEIKVGAKSNHIYMATPENAKSIAIFFDDISEEITEYILREAPAKVICLSQSFVDSQTLTNFDFQMQSANIALEIL